MNAPLEPELAPDPIRRGRRWPLGLLSLIGAAAAVVAVFAAREAFGGSSPATTSALPGAAVTVPTLPGPGETLALPDSGDAAADFTIELFDGSKFNLYDHLSADGRPVFLNLWASWCAPCRIEMPHIQAASERYPGVYFLGVAVEDDPNAAEDFAEEIGVTYPLAYDETDRVNVAYPHFGLPATFVITPDRRVVSKYFGGVSESQIDEMIAGAIG